MHCCCFLRSSVDGTNTSSATFMLMPQSARNAAAKNTPCVRARSSAAPQRRRVLKSIFETVSKRARPILIKLKPEIEKPPRGRFGLALQRYLRSELYTRAKASNGLGAGLESLLSVRLGAYITSAVSVYLRYDNVQKQMRQPVSKL